MKKLMKMAATVAILSMLSATNLAKAQELYHIADGAWGNGAQIYGNGFAYETKNFWVDIAIQNLGYNKEVGIVWSDNQWFSWQEASAWYEGSLGDGYEAWGLDVVPCGISDTRRYGKFWVESNGYEQSISSSAGKYLEYAIYYTIDGVTYWDNNNGENYRVYVVDPR